MQHRVFLFHSNAMLSNGFERLKLQKWFFPTLQWHLFLKQQSLFAKWWRVIKGQWLWCFVKYFLFSECNHMLYKVSNNNRNIFFPRVANDTIFLPILYFSIMVHKIFKYLLMYCSILDNFYCKRGVVIRVFHR